MKLLQKCSVVLWCLCIISPLFWYDTSELDAAKELAGKWVIENQWENIHKYKLDTTITRREMVKIISMWKNTTTCHATFLDLPTSDWGCKYAEYALSQWYISHNDYFRPDDSISQIEALKMVMQLYNIEKTKTSDWREWYVLAWRSAGIIGDEDFQYNKKALRGWIFQRMVQEPTSQQSILPVWDKQEIIRIELSAMWQQTHTYIFNTKELVYTSELDKSANTTKVLTTQQYDDIIDAMNALSREAVVFVPRPMVVYDWTFKLILTYSDGTIVKHTSTNDEIEAFLKLIEQVRK